MGKVDPLYQLLAAEQIRELRAKYCWYVAHRQFDKLVGLFTPDGLFQFTQDGKTTDVKGRDALLKVYVNTSPTYPATHNHTVVVTSENEAYGTCTMNARAVAEVPEFGGYYHDKYQRIDGTWYFTERLWFRSWPGPFERSGLDMDGNSESGLSADHDRGKKK